MEKKSVKLIFNNGIILTRKLKILFCCCLKITFEKILENIS